MKNGNPSKFIASHVVGLPKSGIREFFAIAANMEDVVSLGIGEPEAVRKFFSKIKNARTEEAASSDDPKSPVLFTAKFVI